VEQVQDIVEKVLIEEGHAKTAKAYILYRKQHQEIREIAGLLKDIDVVDDYLSMMDWKVKENSNMSYSLQGLNVYATENIISHYWLNKIYPPEIGAAHTNGSFHIHDLGTLGAYCVGWDLKDLLLLGFRGVSGKIESKPAKHFSTALMQIVNYLYTLQGEAAGAQALSNFDTLLAPFIRYDGLKYEDVKQEMQKFLFNMNVPTRVGFQSLAYNEPIIFRRNGKIKVELIGKLIEEAFGENRESIINNIDGYGNPSEDSFAVKPNEKIEMISFNREGEIQWRPVKALIKHRIKTNGFKRIRTGAGEIKVSPAHSLFKSNNGRIKPVMAKELECAKPNSTLNGKNHILAVNKLKLLGDKEKIDLFDLIEELPEKIKKRIFIQASDVPAIKEKIGKLYGSLKEFLYTNGRTDKSTLCKGFRNNVAPFEIYIKYSDEIREDAKIYIKPHNLYDRYLSGEKLKNFVKLVAWYILEGKASGSGIVITLRKKEDKELLDIATALGIKVSLDENNVYGSENKSNTTISNITGLYAYILPYLAGATSKEKTVPSFIFDLNSNYRNIFLETVFKGGGYFDKKSQRISFSSMSDKLLTSISMLSVANEWRVRFIPKSKGRTLLIYKNPGEKLDIIIKDTAGVPVYEINDYRNDWEWEYDISVDVESGEENFVGGTGLVFYHNSPFTNITLDLAVPSYMVDEPAIVGGELKDDNYCDFVDEMDMINRAFAEIMYEGDAKQRPFTFPIPTYNITRDFNWDDLDPLWKMTAKYGIPYFSNFINSDMKPDDARSMCCRLRLDNRELRRRGGGLFGANPKTGSIGVVTINMPRIGYLAKDDDDFFERLDKLMVLAKQSLEIKREVIENLTHSGLHPYSQFYLSDVKKTLGEYWKNHFSTIGLIGMNDALLNFMNKSVGDKEGLRFAEKVLDYMRNRIADFQEETGNIFNLEATPAEGTSYRLSKIDKARYPDIRIYNQEFYGNGRRDVEPYYTNSTQLPVGYTTDVFEALDLQDSLQSKYTGGCIEKGNKVLTDKGLLKIEDIVNNFEKLKPIKALSYNKEKGIAEWDKIVKAVTVDVKKCNKIRIKGERNLDITTSDWHPFFVLERFKPNPVCPFCKEKVGNVKSFAAHLRWNAECRIKYQKFPKYQVVEKRADELKIRDHVLQNFYNLYPENKTKLNSDLMWLIGFFIGNGHISEHIDNRGGSNLKRYKVRFISEHREALEKIVKILKQHFRCRVKVIQNDKSDEELKEVSTSKKEVSEFFFKYGFEAGEKTCKISVPEKVKINFTRTNVFSFLSGLADSARGISNRDFEYYTASPKLADDILEICSNAGISVSKTLKKTKRKNESTIWRLRIPRREFTKIRDQLTSNVGFPKIKENLSNGKMRPVVRIKEISKADVKDNQFYDLMTEKNHNYLAGNDCLVFIHNTVLHIYLGEEEPSPTSIKKLVRKISENYSLPYYTITPTFSVCPDHGYIAGEHKHCPTCKRENKTTECEIYSRVVGYLRPINQWNVGKQQEFFDRKTFDTMEKITVAT
jgi:ribonucleoside-triphosphate reductase